MSLKITSSGEVTSLEFLLQEILITLSSIEGIMKRLEDSLVFFQKDQVPGKVSKWINTTIDLGKKKEQPSG